MRPTSPREIPRSRRRVVAMKPGMKPSEAPTPTTAAERTMTRIASLSRRCELPSRVGGGGALTPFEFTGANETHVRCWTHEEQGVSETVDDVARRHLDAVRVGEPEAMAADYAPAAQLDRGGEIHRGRSEIEAYFRTVPSRLGDAVVVFDELTIDGETATFRWHLEGGADASGTDVLTIREGLIVRQVVHLDKADF